MGYPIINTEVFIKDDYGVLHDYEDCKKIISKESCVFRVKAHLQDISTIKN